MMTHASLFSGIGGFDLAAQWAWFEQVEQLHQRTEQAKRDLEECIKQEGF